MLANDDLGNLGRLGNQMFQYTALRGLAQRHGYEYCLPPRTVIVNVQQNQENKQKVENGGGTKVIERVVEKPAQQPQQPVQPQPKKEEESW